jgi:hypothetical protein
MIILTPSGARREEKVHALFYERLQCQPAHPTIETPNGDAKSPIGHSWRAFVPHPASASGT